MDENELGLTYETLRRFAEDHGLSWVLAEIDEAVALGVVEAKVMRQSSRGGRIEYHELPAVGKQSAGKRRAEEFLTSRPMTQRERVYALLDAFRRVLVDLDDVAQVSVLQLNELPDTAATDVDPSEGSAGEPHGRQAILEIDFEPDEGSVTSSITTEGIRHQSRELVPDVLQALRRTVEM